MSGPFVRLREIIARLRGPQGCPWDQAQTNESLAPKVLEEAYEIVHAIREHDDGNLREELGDIISIILLHAQIASERGSFNIDDALEGIVAKLIRRHPHVFGESKAHDPDSVVKLWDSVKRDEKKDDKYYLSGVAAALPALIRTEKIQRKAAHVDFDWRDEAEVVAKIDEELGETKNALTSGRKNAIADEIGDLLFAVVNLARKRGLDAESLLQSATDKFVARFNEMEDRLRQRGGKLGEATLEELDAIWNEIKSTKNNNEENRRG
jgi:tetrapyrrole methylase family protein / MazG family protein